MLKEFREFALRGSVVELAVGIVIGAAFTAIVTSLVDDVIMPPIGVLLGGLDFSDYFFPLTMRDQTFASLQAARDAGAAVIAYGNFANAIVKFVIIAFALFIVVRQMNRLRRMIEEQIEDDKAPTEVGLLAEIRDLLKEGPSRST